MIKIAIRIDDVTNNMDWDKFKKFEAVLDKYGVKPLIGVIPENKDESLLKIDREDYISWLNRRINDGWSVAIHGYNHLYTTKKGGMFPLNHFSEYAGVPYEKQQKMIDDGIDSLKELGISTNTFMAPAHTFDAGTVKALKVAGIKYITDGFGYQPYTRDGIIYLPISSRRSKDIERSSGYTTLVYHPAMMNDKDFDNFDSMLAKHKSQLIAYSELFSLEAKKQSFFARLSEILTANSKRIIVKLRG